MEHLQVSGKGSEFDLNALHRIFTLYPRTQPHTHVETRLSEKRTAIIIQDFMILVFSYDLSPELPNSQKLRLQ